MPIDAAASPLPSEETTPPVTKMYLTGLRAVLVRHRQVCPRFGCELGSVRHRHIGVGPRRQQRVDLREIRGRVDADGPKCGFRPP